MNIALKGYEIDGKTEPNITILFLDETHSTYSSGYFQLFVDAKYSEDVVEFCFTDKAGNKTIKKLFLPEY